MKKEEMKTTKFQLDFKSLELKTEVKKQAIDSGKSMNQFILDCIENYNQFIFKVDGMKKLKNLMVLI